MEPLPIRHWLSFICEVPISISKLHQEKFQLIVSYPLQKTWARLHRRVSVAKGSATTHVAPHYIIISEVLLSLNVHNQRPIQMFRIAKFQTKQPLTLFLRCQLGYLLLIGGKLTTLRGTLIY